MTGRFVDLNVVETDWFWPFVYQFEVQGFNLHRTRTLDMTETFDNGIAWCADQFGPDDGQRWSYHYGLTQIIFKNQADATAFKLTWV